MRTSATTYNSLLSFDLPAVQRKKVSAAFDGGLVLLREAEHRLGLPRRRLCLEGFSGEGEDL